MASKNLRQIEFGDFQTPLPLAEQVVAMLNARGAAPASVVEPTFGTGSFLQAAIRGFPTLRRLAGVELQCDYFQEAQRRLDQENQCVERELFHADFFDFDWSRLLQHLPRPLMVLGNPPWVTSSQLGALQATNLPKKSNFQNRAGLDAVTGKSNFDIAESILIQLLSQLSGSDAVLALLVKTHVARRALHHAWRAGMAIADSTIYRLDAKRHFGVNADAGLLVCNLSPSGSSTECELRDLDVPMTEGARFGLSGEFLVSDAAVFERSRGLIAKNKRRTNTWRSGIKHDCAAVMELCRTDGGYVNGLDQVANIEDDFVFPLWKGADVARNEPLREMFVIVPQQRPSDETSVIRNRAPRTWEYLNDHRDALAARASSIYRNRPPFSVFGVGPYSFRHWKVAICGLYKQFRFAVIGPMHGKPVLFDDTVYYLSFADEASARAVHSVLTAKPVLELLESMVFWDSKRPITAELLGRVDLERAAEALGIAPLWLNDQHLPLFSD